jgi:hypothetical protein
MATKNVVVLTVLISSFCVVMSSAQVSKTSSSFHSTTNKKIEYLSFVNNRTEEHAANERTFHLLRSGKNQMRKEIKKAGKEFQAKMNSHESQWLKNLNA